MIFALFIILVFAGIMAFVQFSAPPSGELGRANMLAQNMMIWHQAAMLQARDPVAAQRPPNCLNSPPARCAAQVMTPYMWASGAPIAGRFLDTNWNGYLSIVPIGNQTGWQSYLLRNINGQTGSATANNNEAYMLTVFRGFGGGGQRNATVDQKGTVDENNLIDRMSESITERSGIGRLSCTALQCRFNRVVVQNGTGDNNILFNTDAFLNMTGIGVYFTGGTPADVGRTLNGLPAIITRVENSNPN